MDKLKTKIQGDKEERQKRKMTEIMLGESRVMCRSTQGWGFSGLRICWIEKSISLCLLYLFSV